MWWSGVIVPLILIPGMRWVQVVSFIVPSAPLPGRKFEVPIEQDTLCTAELVWTLGRREKSLAHGGNETTVPWVVQSVSQLVYQLHHPHLWGKQL